MNTKPTGKSEFRFVFLLVLGFIFCILLMFYGWNKALLDQHSFRQTQTALTTYYFIKEGLKIDYITPVLGPPWSIPFEFPLFQYITALACKTTNFPLDQTGRTVSVFFWIMCIVPINGLLKLLKVDTKWRWISMLLLYSTPTYIFWSRCFLIESLALFLALAFLYSSLRAVRDSSLFWCVLMTIFGALAAATKATTFLIVIVPLFGFSIYWLWPQVRTPSFRRKIAYLVIGLIVSFLVLLVWTKHADEVKSRNPIASVSITSKALQQWNFGTLGQRLSPRTWPAAFISHFTFTSAFITVFQLAVVLFALGYRKLFGKEIFVLFCGYLAGPLIFYNLFFVHNYYCYENQIYLVLAFALSLYAITELTADPWRNRFRYGVAVLVVFAGWASYAHDAIPLLSRTPTAAAVQKQLKLLSDAGDNDDILVIYGLEWNPSVPYYAGRNAIMFLTNTPESISACNASIADFSARKKIAALVVTEKFQEENPFIEERVKSMQLNPNGVECDPLTKEQSKLYFFLKPLPNGNRTGHR